MKYFLYVFIAFFSCQFALASDDWWIERQIEIQKAQDSYAKKVYGTSARIVKENQPISSKDKSAAQALVRRSVAVDVPTASKVGGSMMKRVKAYAKVPGVQFLGVLAVTQLLEGIGWVMEDGSYVKKVKVEPESPENVPFLYSPTYINNFVYYNPQAAVTDQIKYMCKDGNPSYCSGSSVNSCTKPVSTSHSGVVTCSITRGDGFVFDITAMYQKNPSYEKEPEPKTVPLTPELLGAAMLGHGYDDPDPNFDNTIVNNDVYTGVQEIYEHDPTGTGDEVADDMDDKLRNAPTTSDGKPAPVGDPKYDGRPLSPADTSSDRSWDEKGNEATGKSEPKKDPVTGENTGEQSISVTWPLFCAWASTMCEWYDKWTESDQVYKDHMTKTEEHQGKEKSFWQTVKDWFDWTKDDSDSEDEDPEEPDTSVLDRQFDTTFSASGSCPPNPVIQITDDYSMELPFNKICDFFGLLKFGVLTASSLLACWIVSSAVRGVD